MKNILVATDGSAQAQKAGRAAIAMAKATGADVTFVHVIQIPIPKPLSSEEVDAAKARQAETVFAPLEESAKSEGVAFRCFVLAARDVAHALVDEAKDYDVLVVGHRGLGGLEKLVLGSVSLKVVENAPCDVWVVK